MWRPQNTQQRLKLHKMMEPMPAILDSKILIVDDRAANITLLETLLRQEGYLHVDSTKYPTTVCDLYQRNRYDLILLDLLMPGMDGFQVMENLKKIEGSERLSILVVTAQPDHKLRAMQAGAKDFISKPFDHSEMLTRIHYVLEVGELKRRASDYNKRLEETVEKRTVELRRSEKMFRELAANIPQALCIRDMDRQTIEYVNPAWTKLSGLSIVPGDPVAKARGTIQPKDAGWLTHERRKLPATATTAEYRLVKPDKSVRWAVTRSFPIANPSGGKPWLVEITEDVTQRRESQEQLLKLARLDVLTGLPNRAVLYESLQDLINRTQDNSSSVSLLLLDVDQFKNVNDTLGHTAGDALLREFAARLGQCIRPGDIVGRLGGDEFAAILVAPENSSAATDVASRICERLRTPFLLEDQRVSVTASIGIANCPVDAVDMEALFRSADTAMYAAKAAGRNTFRRYSAEMSAKAAEKEKMQGDLRLALGSDEFVLHYQPKVLMKNGRCTGVEALIRWNRRGMESVAPAAFIPALEETGLILPVGAWVIETACKQIREWKSSGLGDIKVAVNVSSQQFREERFVAQLVECARKYEVDPRLLEIEITENTLMADDECTAHVFRGLKQLGLSIAIDDFGTGYSNLAYLKRFQVDGIKIDHTFIRDVTASNDAAAIAAAIINMAHSLRLNVIAEGVETEEQLEFLRSHGCDEVQGYLLSHPLPPKEFSQKIVQETTCEIVHLPASVHKIRVAEHAFL
jgi:diguanylate cyclase (GGDEF)-like protein/PAS domain S-box-containing protein